ncbi:hypothetical protein J6590_003636 [Homalodisca vitripennis]|nr:hypothetical protein J6590_003636 [Homalodisca vitripennis]
MSARTGCDPAGSILPPEAFWRPNHELFQCQERLTISLPLIVNDFHDNALIFHGETIYMRESWDCCAEIYCLDRAMSETSALGCSVEGEKASDKIDCPEITHRLDVILISKVARSIPHQLQPITTSKLAEP